MNACSVASVAHLIPHAGRMLLLEEILQWDEHQLVARTASHLDAGNPLRGAGVLHSACGIEYAAQAMALHGALRAAAPSEGGMLASVREVRLFAPSLDASGEPLQVRARLLSGDARLAMYAFDVQAGAQPLLAGRATVLLDVPPARLALSGRG
jgi:predicted hotdog family 3-hydroxylacyl-ACP dehydratase